MEKFYILETDDLKKLYFISKVRMDETVFQKFEEVGKLAQISVSREKDLKTFVPPAGHLPVARSFLLEKPSATGNL